MKESSALYLKGGVGSGLSFRISNLFNNTNKNILFICDDREKAAYFLNDFENIIGDDNVFYFPSSKKNLNNFKNLDNTNILIRSETLSKINNPKNKVLILTYPEAIFEKVLSKNILNKSTISIKKNSIVSMDSINELLFEYKFHKVNFVSQPGEFSIRGGIIDIFSFSNHHPYRIEFNNDSVESIRSFNVVNQLSIENLTEIKILPNTSNSFIKSKRKNIIDFFSENGIVIHQNVDYTLDKLNNLFSKAQTDYKLSKNKSSLNPDLLFSSMENFKINCNKGTRILLQKSLMIKTSQTLSIEQSPQPAFNRKLDRLINHLNINSDNNFSNFIFCSNYEQKKRFNEILEELDQKVNYKTLVIPIHQGFEDSEVKISGLTDHQIFERYHKFKLKSSYTKSQSLSLKELTHLKIGDFVTHIDHGIGYFGGLQKIEINGSQQETIKLFYADRDVLYISIHSLYKISKFNGKDGKTPKIYKLGSVAWKNLKQKTKSKIKKIAFNLIEVYAKRKKKIGFAFSPDSYLQVELEASFLFEDTPDQIKANLEVKKDMESEQPMDRLICGDVGFGKTEIAIRAAFKAVENSKQVVILVPTTILAFQHYKTFLNRLKDFPVNIEYLNRFKTNSERKKILENLKSGKIDIIIGTHQLINNKIIFKSLGLLIVDEEQKFGVGVKEKLRTLKTNIDVLTLTATPIPRTLQFSLMAARDLSIISTPPPNRYPIESEVIRFNENIIKNAIIYEIQRGGQIFFIHNRVDNINEVSQLIQRLIPKAKIRVAHGKMKGKDLEINLLDFMNNEFDILIATTIIENGLDVPNANTIFINNAQNFGLSDLHQMRGRVGRSNKKAFCFFITPDYNSISKDAQKRIQAIEQYSELGSGIKIAMKDLEIRGAGNLLGGEQSGFINDIGFETYHKIIQEAINELKENEFKDLFKNENKNLKNYVKEVKIDSDFEILIPDNYINTVSERLKIYKQLNTIKSEDELSSFKKNLKDRFGKIPYQVYDLFDTIRLKWKVSKLGIEKLIIKNNECSAYFISDKNNEFYKSKDFTLILNWIKKNPKKLLLKEKTLKLGLRLILRINNIESINALNKLFSELK
ncbi:MAG: transcription-repair coupling factor [Flavobacteriaceae bacterium]|nr:transcription-repair coupling factor [Flavobacteriaceae bacterium]